MLNYFSLSADFRKKKKKRYYPSKTRDGKYLPITGTSSSNGNYTSGYVSFLNKLKKKKDHFKSKGKVLKEKY